jgi:hypothetical protein
MEVKKLNEEVFWKYYGIISKFWKHSFRCTTRMPKCQSDSDICSPEKEESNCFFLNKICLSSSHVSNVTLK